MAYLVKSDTSKKWHITDGYKDDDQIRTPCGWFWGHYHVEFGKKLTKSFDFTADHICVNCGKSLLAQNIKAGKRPPPPKQLWAVGTNRNGQDLLVVSGKDEIAAINAAYSSNSTYGYYGGNRCPDGPVHVFKLEHKGTYQRKTWEEV